MMQPREIIKSKAFSKNVEKESILDDRIPGECSHILQILEDFIISQDAGTQ